LTLSIESTVLLLAGVDEAGRGPLVGPVVAAAVILDPSRPIEGIGDSKKLSPATREYLAVEIRAHALAWSIASADAAEIDAINILQATHLAMRRALAGLRVAPARVQVDGNRCPHIDDLPYRCEIEAIIGGDALVPAIGAASILAKTARDAMLVELDMKYPGYGFAAHKGYATPEHYAALQRLGPTPLHRRSFAPVRLAEEGKLQRQETRRKPRKTLAVVDLAHELPVLQAPLAADHDL
jgi:ribonuclease HII